MAEKTKLDLYYHYSEKAGDIARNLAFVGFAVIWIFRVDWAGHTILPKNLLFPAILLLIGLAVDLLHYCGKAMYWAWIASFDSAPEDDAKRTRKIGFATICFLALKSVFIIWAYVLLIYYLLVTVWVFKTDNPSLPFPSFQQVNAPTSHPASQP